MGHKNTRIFCTIFVLLALSFAVLAITVAGAQSTVTLQPSEVELGDIRNATVTLYYYDSVNHSKGNIVHLPDGQNPQEVEWDPAKSAPGTYTFYKVPFGVYYIEAVHNNHSYFAVVDVGEGTTTANVAIPPEWKPVESAPVTVTPSPVPSPSPSASPSSTPMATPSPGMTTISALAGLTLVALYVVYKRE